MRAFLSVLILVAGCGAAGPPARLPGDASRLPPPVPAPDGWMVAEGPVEYLPGTLYEYMDGGAERFEALGFRRLIHLRYQYGDDPLACITLDLFDMGTDLGAFGIYSAGRPRSIEVRPWGTEGYRVGTIASAYQGCVFIHGEADDERSSLVAELDRLMDETAARVEGEVSPPAILALLPTAGRVPRSERYFAADLLGYSFLPGGVLAEYEIDGLSAELFFTEFGGAADARRALNRLSAELEQRGAVIVSPPDAEFDGFRFTDSIMGSGSVVRIGVFLAGFYGQAMADDRERILDELAAALEGRGRRPALN